MRLVSTNCPSTPVSPSKGAPSSASASRDRLGVALALSVVFLGFLLVPRVQSNPGLLLAFVGAGAALVAWTGILWVRGRRRGLSYGIEFAPLLKSHYIQASVQLCIYAYWGWYWRDVYAEAPLILAQFVFLYAFDALLSWTRGRAWRFGCGPLPIVLSTNVFIWFKDDWYVFQFLLVAVGALGKELIKWNRNGKRTHIFNPSAFTLALFSIVLIATGTTNLTWAERIAKTTGDPPQIYVVIFLLGIVVQYFFSVTLMTLSAAATIGALSLLYLQATGTPYFVFSNVPAPVFLGLHLLMTDPSTSPRSNGGKILFGTLYGLMTFALFWILGGAETPTIYDKLLPVPILNASVRWIDRVAQRGILGSLGQWEGQFNPSRINLAHMGCWGAIFVVMLSTGFVEGAGRPMAARTFEFWKKEQESGNPYAARGMLEVLKALARDGSSAAWNELGGLYIEGKVVKRDPSTAARYFAKASRMGDFAGSANLAAQFLGTPGAASGKTVSQAFDHLERECAKGTDGVIYELLGRAYETGRGRPLDRARARALYQQGCTRGSQAACSSLERVRP